METSEQTETQYFLVIDGQKRGPFPLAGLIDAGMADDTPVWWEGLESWPRAGKIPKLVALLEAERRRRRAERRAERLPEPAPIRRLGLMCLLANLPTAVLFFAGSTALWTALVLWLIADRPAEPAAAQAGDGLVRAAWWLLAAGVAGTVLGLPLFVVEAVFIARLAWQSRTVVRMAVPSRRDEPGLDLVGDLKELANVDFGGPSLPMFEWQDLFLLLRPRPGVNGMPVVLAVIGLVLGTIVLMVGPAIFCLLRPQMLGRVITVAVVLAIYGVVHVPLVITMLLTIYRTGYGLNAIIDLYRLKTPWAPIALAFWTAVCGLLAMAGPFSLIFFIFLALWTRRTSESAAAICDPESRAIIAVPLPLPEKASSKPALNEGGSWSAAAV